MASEKEFFPSIKEWPAKHVEIQPIAGLVSYASNARTHSDKQVDQIAASMNEWGWTNPILVDEAGMIIAGHGRVMAAKKLGYTEAPVMTAKGWTEAQKKAYVLADNQLALNAGWDASLLTNELKGLDELGFDMDLLGFDNLADLMPVDGTEGLTDEDAVPDAPEVPVTVEGDVWLLGRHRLMCGDSTSIDAVEKLMDGQRIDLVHTDPPYGIEEKGDRSKRGGITQGNNLKDFNDKTTDAAKDSFALCAAMNIPRQVWWGANYYSHAVPETANWLVWDKRVEEKQKDMNSDCELAWVKSKWSSVRIFRHLWKGLIKASEHGQRRVHPTQKPVALVEWVFDYYKDVSTVLDLFGGSGSTLIGAEKQSKSCYMMEFEPHYCDVIINRWQDFTGKEATLEATGETYAEKVAS